jgi:hypothetical protein
MFEIIEKVNLQLGTVQSIHAIIFLFLPTLGVGLCKKRISNILTRKTTIKILENRCLF